MPMSSPKFLARLAKRTEFSGKDFFVCGEGGIGGLIETGEAGEAKSGGWAAEVVITEGEKEFANEVAGEALSGAFEGTGGFGCAGHVSQGRGETDQGIAQIVATEAEFYGALIDWDGLSFAAAAVEGKCGFEPDNGVLRISPA
jgi:hypothetical protein